MFKLMIFFIMYVLFTLMGHPMSMVFFLFFATLIFSLFLYNCYFSFWLGYVLILVMLSGILVLFTYMASLNSNDKFFVNIFFLSFIFFFIIIFNLLGECSRGYEISFKMWDQMLVMISVIGILFLFLMMVLVVKLSSFEEGAVRV